MSSELHTLSAIEIASGVHTGTFSAEEVTRDSLDHISKRDETINAWVFIDPDLALAQAKIIDNRETKGMLAGVPFGVKDIIDVRGMPTGMGSSIYEDYRPLASASSVSKLQAAGAIIMGKTATCEFAGLTPTKTTNPFEVTRTPGGSSSGSAAAVSDRMVPAAFGTQTGGSILRPSSYCGIVGFKPSFGTFSLNGVFPAAESLDTLGLHTRTIEDVQLLSDALLNRRYTSIADIKKRLVVGLCRTWMWDDAAKETREAVELVGEVMQKSGATLIDLELPEEYQWLADVRSKVNAWERAYVMSDHWLNARHQLSDQLRNTIEIGLNISYEEYLDSVHLMETCRARMNQNFKGCDILLTPVVDGEAPKGLEDTGSPRFQALWTMLHVPTISVPIHSGPNGMPVGVQLVGPFRADDKLIAASHWLMGVLE